MDHLASALAGACYERRVRAPSGGRSHGCWVIYPSVDKGFLDQRAASYYELPLWPFILGAAPVMLWAWRGTLRRGTAGLCRSCRYPLAGLARKRGSIVCPECGHAQPAATAPSPPAPQP